MLGPVPLESQDPRAGLQDERMMMMTHEEQVGSVLSSPSAASVLAGCRAGEEAVHLELCPRPWVGGPGRLRSCLPGM